MRYKTDCPCYSEVYMGNPGGVPHCSQYGLEPDCENCKHPKRTKADRVRAMTDEALAEFLEKVGGCGPSFDNAYCNNVNGCPEGSNCWLEWLRQEATDADN